MATDYKTALAANQAVINQVNSAMPYTGAKNVGTSVKQSLVAATGGDKVATKQTTTSNAKKANTHEKKTSAYTVSVGGNGRTPAAKEGALLDLATGKAVDTGTSVAPSTTAVNSSGGGGSSGGGSPAASATKPAAKAKDPYIGKYESKSYADDIKAMYDANLASQKAQLEGAYNQNLENLEGNRESIAQRYQEARNASAADYERQRRNFNEQAMMNGLNTGTGSQAQLAMNAAQQKAQGGINASESSDISTLERDIANLKTQYQADINAAIADSDFKKAAALLDEYNAQYQRDMQAVQLRASYGDFSAYAAIYGKEAAVQAAKIWARQNPNLAYSMGYLTAADYKKLTGVDAPGTSSSGGGGGGRSYGGGVQQQQKSGDGLSLEDLLKKFEEATGGNGKPAGGDDKTTGTESENSSSSGSTASPKVSVGTAWDGFQVW